MILGYHKDIQIQESLQLQLHLALQQGIFSYKQFKIQITMYIVCISAKSATVTRSASMASFVINRYLKIDASQMIIE